jgi:gluconolactonase
MTTQLDCVAEGLAFPEGPIAMADGSVILVEIRRGTLSRVTPDGVTQVIAELGGGPNGAAIGRDGCVYVCNNGGRFHFTEIDGRVFPGLAPKTHQSGAIQRVNLATGAVDTLYTEVDGWPLWAPNDLVFDSTGGFWFTDYGRNDGRTLQLGGLFYARADGSGITRARGGMMSPNGVGLSPDEKTVYVADTSLGRLWAFELSGPGAVGPAPFRQHAAIVATLNGNQMVDSLAVEAGGNICVATLMNGGITVFTPQGETEHIAFPDMMTTNICFGGRDMRDAWITCSSTGRLFKTRWPRPGLKLAFNG